MHLVDAVNHRLWIGIARGLELMTAPLVLGPVVPVLHDVVDGYLSLTELSQRREQLVLCLVALTTLPEAQRPLRVERGLARQRAIARDDLVEVLACNEVVVHVARHLAPDGELALVGVELGHAQSAIGHVAVGLPLDAQLHAPVLAQHLVEPVGIGIPGCAPTLGHHLLTVDVDLDVASIIEHELILLVGGGLDEALVDHRRAIETEALGQVLDATGLRQTGRFGSLRAVELVIEAVLVAHQLMACTVGIGTREVSLPTLLVVETESTVQLQVFVGITKTAVAVSVPQQTVVLV